MAEIKVEREPGYEGDRRRSVWPFWLAGALGVAGLLAVLTLSDRPAPQAVRDTTVMVGYQGRTLSNVGAKAVAYPDAQMRKVGTTEEGIELYRHQTQPWVGGGGGGGGGRPTVSDPVYMKTGNNTYLPLKQLGPKR